MKSILDFFSAIRWQNILLVFLAQFFLILKYSSFNSSNICVLFLTAITLGLGNIENNIVDKILDRNCKGKPENRFINWIEKKRYIYIDVFYFVLILLFSIFQNYEIGAWILIAYILLKLYNYRLKKMLWIGNISIAFLCALTLLILDIQVNDTLNLLAINIFILTLIREIIKDKEDEICDTLFDYNTVAICYSEGRLRILFVILFLVCCMNMIGLYSSETLIILSIVFLSVVFYYIWIQKWNKANLAIKITILFGIVTIPYI
jgi:4-hydroxybenzoate polyprenyltransferase